MLRRLDVPKVANPAAVESMHLGAASFGLVPSSVSLCKVLSQPVSSTVTGIKIAPALSVAGRIECETASTKQEFNRPCLLWPSGR